MCRNGCAMFNNQVKGRNTCQKCQPTENIENYTNYKEALNLVQLKLENLKEPLKKICIITARVSVVM